MERNVSLLCLQAMTVFISNGIWEAKSQNSILALSKTFI